MHSLSEILNPTNRQLRQFGVALLLVLPLAAWYWSHGAATWVVSVAAAGVIGCALGFAFPRSLRPLFVGLSLLTWPLGVVVHELLLCLIFWGVFFPLGLLFRCLGRDVLATRLEPESSTYWQMRPQPASVPAEAGLVKLPGIVGEFWQFLAENKKWWLLPIVVMLFAFGLIASLAGTGVGPFIYTLF